MSRLSSRRPSSEAASPGSAEQASELSRWSDTLNAVGLLCDLDLSSCRPHPDSDSNSLRLCLSEAAQLRQAVDRLAGQAADRCRQLGRLLADLEALKARSAALERAMRALGLRDPDELDGTLGDLLAISDAYAATVPLVDAVKAIVFGCDHGCHSNGSPSYPSNDCSIHRRNGDPSCHSNAALLAELERWRRELDAVPRASRAAARVLCAPAAGSVRQLARALEAAEATSLPTTPIPAAASLATPEEAAAQQALSHFGRLFDSPASPAACIARINKLHRQLTESQALLGNLKRVLRLGGDASGHSVATAVARLAAACEGEARECLSRYLGPGDLSELRSRLAEYDAFFSQFDGLVTELRAELGVQRLGHILPAVRACVRVARAAGWDGGG